MKEKTSAYRHEKLVQEGWDLIPGLLSDSLITVMSKTLELLANSQRNPSDQVLFTHQQPPPDIPPLSSIMTQWLNPWRWDECSTKDACAILKEILFGNEADKWLLFQEILFMKQPGQGTFHWHQDMPFFPLDKPDGFTCWIALDTCTKENGALMIAPRTHLSGTAVSINLHTGKSQDGGDFSFDEKGVNFIQPNLKPGDALLFHPCTFHASKKNHTELPRRAWSTVWFRKGVRIKAQNAPNHPILNEVNDATLVTGIL
jgi:hypothetical protein